MTLPSSGQLSLSMLISEFGGGTKLTDFYRGGSLVPNIAANNNIPTSGQISLSQFYGATKTSPFTPVLRSYGVGTGTETVPTGATQVRIVVWGGGQKGGGAPRFSSIGGNGGDAGSVAHSLYACSGGQTLQYNVGGGGSGGTWSTMQVGGDSTVSAGSLSITNMRGSGGGSAQAPAGGNVENSQGGYGMSSASSEGGLGGSAVNVNVGGTWLAYGGGGDGSFADGGSVNMAGYPGDPGRVIFYYT